MDPSPPMGLDASVATSALGGAPAEGRAGGSTGGSAVGPPGDNPSGRRGRAYWIVYSIGSVTSLGMPVAGSNAWTFA